MNVYIYHDNTEGKIFPYVVVSGQSWPSGDIETVCMTKLGAKLKAKRVAKRGPARKKLVAVID